MNELTVKSGLKAFAEELELALRNQGHPVLAQQVEHLPLLDRCRCGDSSCSTFYTAAKPAGTYGSRHSNTVVQSPVGMIILDVVDGEIRCVEVLDRPDVQKVLTAVLP